MVIYQKKKSQETNKGYLIIWKLDDVFKVILKLVSKNTIMLNLELAGFYYSISV